MKKNSVKKYLLFCVSFLMALAVVVTTASFVDNGYFKSIGENGGSLNQISLDSTNKLTVDEGGTYYNPKPSNSSFIRKTKKGGDVSFRFSAGRTITYVDDGATPTNFAKINGKNAYFANETYVRGIQNIRFRVSTLSTSEVKFKIFCDFDKTLWETGEDAHYKSGELILSASSSKTFEVTIPEQECGLYHFFRLEMISEDAGVWLKFIEVNYICEECKFHEYGDIISEALPVREEDGTKTHYECPGCGRYFDIDKKYTTADALKIKSKVYSYSPPTEQSKLQEMTHFDNLGNLETVVFDIKFNDPDKRQDVGFRFYENNNLTNYSPLYYIDIHTGDIWCEEGVHFEYNDGGYQGLSLTKLSDGWWRVTANISTLLKSNGTFSTCDYLKFQWPDTTENRGKGMIEVMPHENPTHDETRFYSADPNHLVALPNGAIFGHSITGKMLSFNYKFDDYDYKTEVQRSRYTSSDYAQIVFVNKEASDWNNISGEINLFGDGTANKNGIVTSLATTKGTGWYNVKINVNQFDGNGTDRTCINSLFVKALKTIKEFTIDWDSLEFIDYSRDYTSANQLVAKFCAPIENWKTSGKKIVFNYTPLEDEGYQRNMFFLNDSEAHTVARFTIRTLEHKLYRDDQAEEIVGAVVQIGTSNVYTVTVELSLLTPYGSYTGAESIAQLYTSTGRWSMAINISSFDIRNVG